MDIEECVKTGLRYYNNPDGGKFNCSESTLLALCSYLGIEKDYIPGIATPFGGGVGGCGRICGCLAGASMAIGLKTGRSCPDESKDPATEAVRKLMDRFQEKYGTTDCSELIGIRMRDVELSDEEKAKQHEDICNGIMSDTVKWAADILAE